MGRSATREWGVRVMAVRGNRRLEEAGLSVRDWIGVAVYSALLFVGALFYVWVQARVVGASVQLAALRHEERVLETRNQELDLEIDVRRAPENLSRVALEQLKMVTPAPGQVRVVTFESSRKR